MIIFSKHAEQRLRERNITNTLVEQTILLSDLLNESRLDRMVAIKRFGNRYLKAIFIHEGHDIIVVTSHWVRKPKGMS